MMKFDPVVWFAFPVALRVSPAPSRAVESRTDDITPLHFAFHLTSLSDCTSNPPLGQVQQYRPAPPLHHLTLPLLPHALPHPPVLALTPIMVLGRLTHYAFDALAVSAIFAGVKKSTGFA